MLCAAEACPHTCRSDFHFVATHLTIQRGAGQLDAYGRSGRDSVHGLMMRAWQVVSVKGVMHKTITSYPALTASSHRFVLHSSIEMRDLLIYRQR